MSVQAVKDYLKKWNLDSGVMEMELSSATVELAAEAVGVIPARIAKTLSFKDGESCILIVTAGDAKVDNTKFKAFFKMKAKMLSPDEVFTLTGHPVGGVCPFALKEPGIRVYTDISMKRFDTVFPACGSGNSAVELTCDELFLISRSLQWIDVCKEWH
ncbi:MAG: YbaK/EbsC family protein [Bacillota bacterium]|nr:YbaK/EbsC family protein [Bacillota bacterium]